MPSLGHRKPKAMCRIEGCGTTVKALGCCLKHYTRQIRHGDAGVKLAASNGEARSWLEAHVDYQGDDCLIWPFSRMDNGYAIVRHGGSSRVASRVMCELAHGAPPTADHEAAHSCGFGHLGCVNPSHVRWATHLENVADQIKHGTTQRGSKNVNAKLTEANVRSIRAVMNKKSQRGIAAEFGVSSSVIRDIAKGKTWGWLS